MSVCLFLSVSVSSPLFPSPTLSSPLPFPLPLFPILILHIMCGMIELPQELFSSGIVKLGQITLLISLKKEFLCGRTHRGACPENSENNGLLVNTTEHLKICAPFLGVLIQGYIFVANIENSCHENEALLVFHQVFNIFVSGSEDRTCILKPQK